MAIEMVVNYKLVIRASSKSYRMYDVKHLEFQKKKKKNMKILLPEHNKISRCFFFFIF